MRKTLVTLTLGGIVLSAIALVARAEESKNATITGELVDTQCYLAMNAKGAQHQKCATKCAKMGIPVGVLDEKSGNVYTIAVAASAFADVMAQNARVSGDLFEGSHIIVPEKVEVQGANGQWTEVKLPAMK